MNPSFPNGQVSGHSGAVQTFGLVWIVGLYMAARVAWRGSGNGRRQSRSTHNRGDEASGGRIFDGQVSPDQIAAERFPNPHICRMNHRSIRFRPRWTIRARHVLRAVPRQGGDLSERIPDADVEVIVDTLRGITRTAVPHEVA
ncbi:hypothetical protein [Skermania piniformis]|uniref:Uncharacterized protein n=3 Tax=Skermania pinensis TaxID=39122 RepID=A0ABX8SAL7_9ACTN|nr:hypothetical protein [Skermania piniformis]QXQ13595.1 hypothetical protein KV203_17560 [Skermania piniformis]